MNRRYLLQATAAIPLASLLAAPASLWGAGRPALRRARPGDPAWPGPARWAALKARLEGNLIVPRPLFADCRPSREAVDCKAALSNFTNPYYIGDQPGGTQVSGWLDAWTPATSAYVVAARTTRDVVAAVDFASTHNLRLAVKGGGHSYQGTSNAADSLLIWTRAMNDIVVHEAFVGSGCAGRVAAAPAVTVGAGCMWMDVYDAVTTKAGRYVQGGGCATVGVAGLVQSGGFGSFSKRYGLAAASLLEAEVVTADGQARIVNACKNPDLFWALKGGGGGSFGVVTRLTLRTHDLPATFGGVSAKIKATSDGAFRRLVRRFVDVYAETLFNPHWGEQASIQPGNVLAISMVNAGLTDTEAREAWRPFLDWVAAAPGDFSVVDPPNMGVAAARGWWDAQARRVRGSKSVIFDKRPDAPPTHAWWSGDQEQVGLFLYGYDSAWLPASLLEAGRREGLVDALVAASRHMAVGLHFNKGLAGAPEAAREAARNTATNPDVLSAFALAIVATGGPAQYPAVETFPVNLTHARQEAGRIDLAMAELRRVAPKAGSYVSESNYFNPDWRGAFWGANHARLKAVKAKYDPTGLFIVHHGVGSEDWSADGFTRTEA